MSSTVSQAEITRAVIYCRVSKDKAGGRSVEEQERECRQECERRGWPVTEVLIDNDRSASRYATKDRPEYERLRSILRPGDVLVSWEASRLSRSMATMIELRELCLNRNVALSYGGQLIELEEPKFVIDAMMAEQEARKTRDRIMRAHRGNLAAGKPHGRPLYGYRIVRDPETGKSVNREPHPVQAPLITEAVRRLLDGESNRSVLRWLKSQDPATPWTNSSLRRIVTNPVLAGYRTHYGEVTGKGTWEPLITDDQLKELRGLYAVRRSGPRGVAVKHLLTGIARCAVCDAPLARRLGGRDYKNGGRYEVLACPGGHVARKMTAVDDAVTEVFEELLSTPAVRERFAAQQAAPPDDTKAQDHLQELQRRRTSVKENMVNGRMPVKDAADVLTQLDEMIKAAEAAAAPVYTSPIVAKVMKAPDPVEVWRGLPVEDKRDFVRSTVRVTVGKVGKGRWHERRQGIEVVPIRR